jgi:hypothetical protein
MPVPAAPRLGGVPATRVAAAAGVLGTLAFSALVLRLLGARDRAVGQAGMRQRAENPSGRLTVDSATGRGTTVAAHVPVGEFPPPFSGQPPSQPEA